MLLFSQRNRKNVQKAIPRLLSVIFFLLMFAEPLVFGYRRTSPYGHLSINTDSLTWSRENAHTFFVKITSIISTLYNTDNGHEISAPERKFIQAEPLYRPISEVTSGHVTLQTGGQPNVNISKREA